MVDEGTWKIVLDREQCPYKEHPQGNCEHPDKKVAHSCKYAWCPIIKVKERR